MHRVLPLCALLACGGPVDDTLSFCEGATTARYDLAATDGITAFPDNAWTVPDDSSPTGLRVDVANAPWTEAWTDSLDPVISEASKRSGFARLGSVVLRFDGPVQEGPSDDASLTDTGIQWVNLATGERVPFTSSLGDAGDQLILKPLRPMAPGTKHAVIVTNDHTDAGGGCITPAPAIQDRLNGVGDAWTDETRDAVDAVGIDPSTVSHVVVFTTHDDLNALQSAAAHIQTQDYTWTTAPTCEVGERTTRCTGTFVSNDYRTGQVVESGDPVATWELQAYIWLPNDVDGPMPTAFFGHGLNSDVTEGGRVADAVADLGIALVGVDALHHGVHPSAADSTGLAALNFLGINLDGPTIDAPQMRGSFDQSNLDRLQFLRLLTQNPDVDGDGQDDLDMDQLMYYGISLGGLMGPSLVANTDQVNAVVTFVAGGNLSVFATDNVLFKGVMPLLETLVGPPDQFRRTLSVLQTAVDPSDPAIWAPHVLDDRLVGDTPDMLFPVAMVDDVVPQAAAKQLARALNIPHLTPIPDPVPLVESISGPVQGNHPSGATVAYFQLDRVTFEGTLEAANHDNVPKSEEGLWMANRFLESHLEGQAVIEEPYGSLGTPSL